MKSAMIAKVTAARVYTKVRDEKLDLWVVGAVFC